MNCINCNSKLNDGVYVCRTSDYRIEDGNSNLVCIVETHSLPSDSEEINDSIDIKYCNCGYWKT